MEDLTENSIEKINEIENEKVARDKTYVSTKIFSSKNENNERYFQGRNCLAILWSGLIISLLGHVSSDKFVIGIGSVLIISSGVVLFKNYWFS